MCTYYDSFDYRSYWVGREYEHKSEIIALTSLLNEINKVNNILEIGAGYGRLVSTYINHAKKIFISDPSKKLLALAKKNIHSNKVFFINSPWEHLSSCVNKRKVDLIIMVRVLHHIKNPEKAFKNIQKILNHKGYFILEFPNKIHTKAIIKELLRGNFTVLFDIFPKDIRCQENVDNGCIAFNNYHPDYVFDLLRKNNFEIVDVRSVSNIRSKFLKKHVPLNLLCSFEKYLQKILSGVHFGPSTFVLARKI